MRHILWRSVVLIPSFFGIYGILVEVVGIAEEHLTADVLEDPLGRTFVADVEESSVDSTCSLNESRCCTLLANAPSPPSFVPVPTPWSRPDQPAGTYHESGPEKMPLSALAATSSGLAKHA
ncbi:hypothetical protein RJ55_03973 [Drechmeria coniospora]|nr:hypothetical protein RJ55_03973 [Drechmeria coniospora]